MDMSEMIITQPTPGAPKGILYGPPGIGKSTFGGHAGALLIDCENGAGAIQCARTPYLHNWPTVQVWLQFIEREEHPYKRIAIDTLDWLLRRMEEEVTGSKGKLDSTLNRSHGGYGNGKQVLKNYIYQELLPLLDRIVARGIAVVMLAHASRQDITDIDGVTTEKTVADVPQEYLNIFVEWSDFVCLARHDPDGNRVLITQETTRCMAKNRYDLPPVLPFDWPSFAEAVGKGLAAKFPKTQPPAKPAETKSA